MLRTTGTSPRRGRTRFRRKAEIANKTAVPIVDRSTIAHIGGRSCRIALMTGQLVPQAKAMAARRAIASPRRKREDCIRSTPNEISGNACGDRVPTETRAGEASRLESSRLRRCGYNGEIASPVRHSSARTRQALRLLRCSEQQGKPALSVMTTQHMEGVLECREREF